MSKKIKQITAQVGAAEDMALQRRRFLGGMALSAGAVAMLGAGRDSLGAEPAPTGLTAAAAAASPGVSQPPPLAEVEERWPISPAAIPASASASRGRCPMPA